eukprot:GILK01008769.1.p1 GENE.GILK01008769.1~~GILK01008769.1.p1  ORF type:complete len:301 (-),score=28.55 GILK01008769.1:41-907(-)
MAPQDVTVHALAGGSAGASVDLVLFPIDTIKTRLQARKENVAKAALTFRGFYAGLGSAMAGSFPAAAAFFSTYETSKRYLSTELPSLPLPFVHMLSAATADVASCAVRVPFEVVKQRLQAGMHRSSLDAIRTIVKDRGFRGLYAGYSSTVLREIPFDAIEFALYEHLKSSWKAHKQKRQLETWESSVCGSIAGGVAAAVTTPLDVIKTRLMTQSYSSPAGSSIVLYTGVRNALSRILAEEGASALFRGIVPRVIWISGGGAIFFGAYETVLHALKKDADLDSRTPPLE